MSTFHIWSSSPLLLKLSCTKSGTSAIVIEYLVACGCDEQSSWSRFSSACKSTVKKLLYHVAELLDDGIAHVWIAFSGPNGALLEFHNLGWRAGSSCFERSAPNHFWRVESVTSTSMNPWCSKLQNAVCLSKLQSQTLLWSMGRGAYLYNAIAWIWYVGKSKQLGAQDKTLEAGAASTGLNIWGFLKISQV